jgi:hypothetical protein
VRSNVGSGVSRGSSGSSGSSVIRQGDGGRVRVRVRVGSKSGGGGIWAGWIGDALRVKEYCMGHKLPPPGNSYLPNGLYRTGYIG